jgi:hypothetical protein
MTTHGEGRAGSSPAPQTNFREWLRGEPIGLEECPYMRRWVVNFGGFAIRLHRWEKSDDDRAFHDHPWWFWTIVLRGRYIDISPDGEDTLTVGSFRFRPSSHKHTVHIIEPGTWTLLLTGRPMRRWGFWVGNKLIKRDKYFATMGHHPCDHGGMPIRRKPDGTRIERK